MSVIERGGRHQPPEFIERKVCGECGIVPPYCDHDRAKLVIERYVPADRLTGAVSLIEQAAYCVTAALNCPAHPWHGSDDARRWLMRANDIKQATP